MKQETATCINADGGALTVGKTYDVISRTYHEDAGCSYIVIMNDIDVVRQYVEWQFILNNG